MKCNHCGSENIKVSNTWLLNNDPARPMVRRRRVCKDCGCAWISDETITRWTCLPDTPAD